MYKQNDYKHNVFKRIVTYGDGWMPVRATPESVRAGRASLDELADARVRDEANGDFLAFVKEVWPAFIEGNHHRVMADAFNRIASGELKRLIINMPPRHTKSEFASHLFPAWYWVSFLTVR